MSFAPHLLDELARVFARVALDRLIKEQAAREPRQEGAREDSAAELPEAERTTVVDDVNIG